ncbi:MFS transporter [Candidatus Paracaedibacter symbiosus]|uniref:MFS transporter n=1 Tax=Candidatus Paracaedibacter symbiosus TaxID=244582 RepID=UPI00068E6474|nr:MFS transporter [Candidatus Paracaedibacter symbiosus]
MENKSRHNQPQITTPSYKTLVACMGGNIIEWYDFMIYGYLSSIMGQIFFPSSSKIASLLLSLTLFAIGVIARPLGGIVIGHIGDKFSRKNSLMLSVYLMFGATALIGILPTYHQIGILAPIILFSLRIIQGLAMGGEYAGTMVFMIESAPDNKKGLYGSLAALSLVIGMFLGASMATLIQQLPQEKLLLWGWRIPFFVSVIGILYTLYMRKNLPDTPYFNFIKEKNRPSLTLLKQCGLITGL